MNEFIERAKENLQWAWETNDVVTAQSFAQQAIAAALISIAESLAKIAEDQEIAVERDFLTRLYKE